MAGLLKFVAKYGSKAVKFITAAASTIGKYGAKGFQWVKDNWEKVYTAIDLASSIPDFISWLQDQLSSFFN